MDEWICEKDYTFRLYPKIGTWGCYNDSGHYSRPIHINIINIFIILACIVLAYIIYRKKCDHKKDKQNKKCNKYQSFI